MCPCKDDQEPVWVKCGDLMSDLGPQSVRQSLKQVLIGGFYACVANGKTQLIFILGCFPHL